MLDYKIGDLIKVVHFDNLYDNLPIGKIYKCVGIGSVWTDIEDLKTKNILKGYFKERFVRASAIIEEYEIIESKLV